MFGFLQRLKRRRRFRAALGILVAMHAYSRLTPQQQAQVEDFLVDWYSRRAEIPYAVIRGKSAALELAAPRAFAMGCLNFDTGLPGHKWSDLLPRTWIASPDELAFRFERFHPGTGDALRYLSERGIHFGNELGLGPDWLETMKAMYP